MLGICAPYSVFTLTMYALGLLVLGFLAGRVKR